MSKWKKHLLRTTIAFTLITLPAIDTLADTVVTNQGQMLIGDVQKTATGYSVKTRDGIVQVRDADVRTVLLDHRSAASQKGSSSAANLPRVSKPTDAKTLSILLQEGQNALTAEEYGDARNAFADALTIDPKNAIAGRGLGYAYLKLKKPEKAAPPLKVAASSLPLTRGLVMSLSTALVASHDPMGAVKILSTFLQTHPDTETIDQPMLNALGIALWQADPGMMHSPTFTDGVKLYSSINALLEATQPGKKRWGTEWLDASLVSDRQKARRAQQVKVDQAWANLQDVNSQMATDQAALTAATKLPKSNPDRQKQITAAESPMAALKPKQDTAQADYDDEDSELSKLPGPVFPSMIDLTDADFPIIPAGSDKAVTRYAAAFAVGPDMFVTAAEPVEGANDIKVTTFDSKTFKATVVRMHHGDGLALLEVTGAKLPGLKIASQLKAGTVNCLGYPDVDLVTPMARGMEVNVGAPTTDWTVQFTASPRIPGGPLLKNGLLCGVELGNRDSELAAVPAATLKELESLISNEEPPVQIATDARKAVVLVIARH